jgi:hypothetical protein
MIYINRRYTSEDGLRERVVYHNPFASHKLDPEIFQGKNVIQYGLVDKDGLKEYNKLDTKHSKSE